MRSSVESSIRKALRIALLVGFCPPASLSAASGLQPELRIVLEPESLVDGVPQAFTFVLTNIGDKDLRLPQPNIDCSEPTSKGSIRLDESWQSDTGMGLAKGVDACDFGGAIGPRVSLIETARAWKLLRVGESIYIKASSHSLHYDTSKNGIYRFSATYLPPALSDEAQRQLKSEGIVVPQQKAFTGSIQYRK